MNDKKAIAEKLFKQPIFARGYKPVMLAEVSTETLNVKNVLEMNRKKVIRDGYILSATADHMTHI